MDKNKRKVYFNEFNVLMDNTAYLPIASGLLHAYALKSEIIKSNYLFMPFLFVRGGIKDIVAKYLDPSVVTFSVSMWNEQISLKIAKEVKRRYPSCLIVFGGPQVPYESEDYFNKYNFIDLAVRGDGEKIFSEILERFLVSRDFSGIANISWREERSGKCIRNGTADVKLNDLDTIPSPYLEGLFDYLFKNEKNGMQFQAIIETNRGCPFSCTYCVWGKGGMNKRLRYFSKERVAKEIEWCSKHKIKYLFNADSNFGINKRDLEIADLLVQNKKKYGYPEKFRTCFTKNSDEMIYDLASTLVKHNLEKGITLSFQSLNEEVLRNIKRQNIKISTYKKLLAKFNSEGISVYTELILGLPGESYGSWKSGIEEVIESGLKGQLFVYPCEVYQNTELASKDYQMKFGIVLKRILLTETHGLRRKSSDIKEFQDIVVGTNTMPVNEWERSIIFSWMFMTLYSLKLGFFVLSYLYERYGIKYVDMVEYICNNKAQKKFPVLTRELKLHKKHAQSMLNGKGRCLIMQPYGEMYWDAEEASFLRLSEQLDSFYKELEIIVKNLLDDKMITYKEDELKAVFIYQNLRMPRQNGNRPRKVVFNYNLPEYFEASLLSRAVSLIPARQTIEIEQKDFGKSKAEFGREAIIWGRKSNNILINAKWR